MSVSFTTEKNTASVELGSDGALGVAGVMPSSGHYTGELAILMAKLRAQLTSDKYERLHCLDVAIEVADALIAGGARPTIGYFVPVEGTFFRPQIFHGQVQWARHAVVLCDDLAFDPLLSCPVAVKDYGMEVFNSQIKCYKIAFNSEALLKRYNERKAWLASGLYD